jgi:rhomboid family GlyGly-CTERM serine protease
VLTQNKTCLGRRIPVVTLAVVGAAVAVFLAPWVQPWFVYDRPAILKGELWRLASGNWVHFTPRHFICDTLVVGIAGYMIENRGYRNFGWLAALCPLIIGIAIFIFNPQLQTCGGLSGVATAAMIFLSLQGLAEQGVWRWICLGVLMATIGKLVFEAMTGRSLFAVSNDGALVLVSTSHIAGALAGVAFGLWNRILRREPLS